MLETIFITLLQISAVAAAVILIVKLLTPFLSKNFAAKWRYWIWLFIAVRLVIPFHISFVSPPLNVEIPNPQIPISTPAETLEKETESSASAPIYNEETPFLPTLSPNEKQEETMSISLIQVCLLVWAAGVIIFAVGQGTRYILFQKRILRWGNAPSGQTADLLASSAAELGLGKIPVLLVNAEAASPMIIGLVRPVLLLPHEHYTNEDLRFIFRHELTHFRRHDIWYKLFLIIVNAIHWFNPLVYLMVREASADLELACDDEVMKSVSLEERRAYSETILAAVTHKKGVGTALSTHFQGGTKRLQQRFANILNIRRKKNGLVVLLLVILLTAVTGGAVGCNIAQSGSMSNENALASFPPGEKDATVYQANSVLFTESGRTSERLRYFARGTKMTAANKTVVRKELEGPFQIELVLPEGWDIRIPSEGEGTYAANVYSPYNIYLNDYCIGTVGYGNIFDYLLEENSPAPEEEYIDIFWPVMQEGQNTWNDSYLPIKENDVSGTAVCNIRYSAEMLGTDADSYNKGILAYDKGLQKYIALELDESSVTDEQLLVIAGSLKFALAEKEESPVSMEEARPGEKYRQVSVELPASGWERTEYNEAIFDIDPFTATLKLPSDWTLAPAKDGEDLYGAMLFSPVNIYHNNDCIGTIGYNTFEIYPDAGDNYRAVYYALMLGSVVSWDIDYTPVKENDTACTATCKVMHRIALPGQDNASAEVIYHPAILSYDRDLLAYIGIEFAEGTVTEEELTEIARSIHLSR